MLVTGLQRVHHAQNLSGVAASRGRVREDEADGLLGVNDEHASDGERDSLLVDVRGILVVQHVIGVCDLPLLVANDGKPQVGVGELIDILDPPAVRLNGVCGKTNQLDATLGELRLELRECA